MKQTTDTSKAIKFINGDLQRDAEKHLRADEITITKDEAENDGEDMYYLDVNDDGYFYANESDRDYDYARAKSLFTKLSEHPQPTDTGNTVSSEVGFTMDERPAISGGMGWFTINPGLIQVPFWSSNKKEHEKNTYAWYDDKDVNKAKETAQRIVQAVNNHDAIVGLLGWFVEHCQTYFPLFPLPNSHEEEKLKAAKELLNNIKVTK